MTRFLMVGLGLLLVWLPVVPGPGYAVFGETYDHLDGKLELQAAPVNGTVDVDQPIRLDARLTNRSDTVLTLPELSEITVLSVIDGTRIHRDGGYRSVDLEPGETMERTLTVTDDLLEPGDYEVHVNYLNQARSQTVTVRVEKFPGWEPKYRIWTRYRDRDELTILRRYREEYSGDTDPISRRVTLEYFRRLREGRLEPGPVLREIDRALETFPGEGRLLKHKGEFLFRTGDERRAVETWIRSTWRGFDRAVNWFEERHDEPMYEEAFDRYLKLGDTIVGRAEQRDFNTLAARAGSAMAHAHYGRGNLDRAIVLADRFQPETAREWRRERGE